MRGDELDVLGLIGLHVAATPDHPAVKDHKRTLTFAELDAEVPRGRRQLAALRVGDGDRVALGISNSVDFLVATLACGWLGAIFVPLAAADPNARRDLILESCEPSVILVPGSPDALGGSLPEAPTGPYRFLTMIAARQPGEDPPPQATDPDRPAYCLYTSGTTGTPKGVLTGHGALTAAVTALIEAMSLHTGTRGLCVSPVHFVGSFGTVFPVPAAGGTLVIPPRESLALPRMFFRILAEDQITHTSFSPTYLRLLLGSPEIGLLASSSLMTMSLGGEALTMTDLRALWGATPSFGCSTATGRPRPRSR